MVDVHDCVSSEDSDIPHDDALYTAVYTTAEAQSAGKGVKGEDNSLTLKKAHVSKGGATNLPATQADLKAGHFNESDLKEWVSILKHGVLGKVLPVSKETRTTSVLNMGWRKTWKLLEKEKEGEPVRRKAKSRLYCKGFQDKRQQLNTYAGTPRLWALMTMLTYAVLQGQSLAFVDISTAFLQAEENSPEKVAVRLPQHLPKLPPELPGWAMDSLGPRDWASLKELARTMRPGEIRELDKALYGLRNAPYLFIEQFREIVRSHGYKSNVAESILLRDRVGGPKDVMAHHIDDVMAAGMGSSARLSIEAIGEKLAMGPITELPADTVGRVTYVGMQFERSAEGMEVHQGDYVKELALKPLPDSHKIPVVDSSTIKPPLPGEVDMTLEKAYRTHAGWLGWAVKTQPRWRVFYDLLAKYSHQPSPKLLLSLRRVLAKMQQMGAQRMTIRKFLGRPRLALFTDGGFESSTGRGRLGFVIRLISEHWTPESTTRSDGSNVLMFSTKAHKQLHVSSSGPELIALQWGVKNLWRLQYLCRSLWGEDLQDPMVVIDCKPVYDQLRRQETISEPKLGPALLYTIQELDLINAITKWSPRKNQEADVLTKAIWPSAPREHTVYLSQGDRRHWGRTGKKPAAGRHEKKRTGG